MIQLAKIPLASIPKEPRGRDRLLILLDADRSSVLGNATNGILSALDLSHALHTQDTDLLLQIMKPMLNPRMTEAVRALSNEYEVLVAIYTARALIAQTLIQEAAACMCSPTA